MLHTITATAVAGTLASLVLGAAPALAASSVTPDAAEGTQKADLLKVKTVNETGVRVRMTFDDIRRSGTRFGQGFTVFVDTDAARRGPELAMTGGLNTGTDYQLVRVRGWQLAQNPLTCSYRLTLDWRHDVAIARIGDDCFGDHSSIRVGVRVNETQAGSRSADWLVSRRALVGPVAQG